MHGISILLLVQSAVYNQQMSVLVCALACEMMLEGDEFGVMTLPPAEGLLKQTDVQYLPQVLLLLPHLSANWSLEESRWYISTLYADALMQAISKSRAALKASKFWRLAYEGATKTSITPPRW